MSSDETKSAWPVGGAIKIKPAEQQAERRARAGAVAGRASNAKRKARAWRPYGEGVKHGW